MYNIFHIKIEGNNDDLNNEIKRKNRRTIYNSLLSSQNPSHLSPIREFETENLGPFKQNIASNATDFASIKTIGDEFINKNEDRFNDIDQLNYPKKIFNQLLNNYGSIYDKFKEEYQFSANDSMVEKIKKILYWNLFTFYYNLYVEKFDEYISSEDKFPKFY